MKHIKTQKQLNEASENLNISDVSNSVFSITEEQLSELIEKLGDKIQGMLNREGRSTKGLALTNSVSDTIRTYLKKHCC
ncbi:MAG: hypothetical protein WDA02_03325 [Saccharofermentanales bacterium]